MLIAAKDIERTAKMAKGWQARQITAWLRAKKGPKDVYKWLKVEGTTADNAERLLYNKYVKDYGFRYM